MELKITGKIINLKIQELKPIGAPTCYNQIKKEIDRNIRDLKIAAIVMGAIELVLFICAVYLVCSVGNDD